MGTKKILMYLVSLIFVTVNCYGQKNDISNLKDLSSLDVKLNDFLTEKYYTNSDEDLQIIFTFKIDSIGEVHSAHILKSTNLPPNKTYLICLEIESNYRSKFIFEKYKNSLEFKGGKYVFFNYRFSSNKFRKE